MEANRARVSVSVQFSSVPAWLINAVTPRFSIGDVDSESNGLALEYNSGLARIEVYLSSDKAGKFDISEDELLPKRLSF